MARIQRLDETVVNRIAAGEVIQRPANAIKEMIENCIDAKSTMISVSVKSGGLKMLQIQDNGCGIHQKDLELVCERFTTSKLAQFEDLKSITTHGFRGEALASISHVAHLTIVSKTKDTQCAYKAQYEDGHFIKINNVTVKPKPCAGNNGTLITVEDLFYNVSVRRKAFKNTAEEFNRICDVVTRYALHNPTISFTLKRLGDNATSLKTMQSKSVLEAIKGIYGAAVMKELLQVNHTNDRLHYSFNCLVSNANYSLKRTRFFLFINNRSVDCSSLKKAIEGLYCNYLPKDKYPFIYLSLSISPSCIDVNVHPTKHEVQFLNEEIIVQEIQTAIDAKLVTCNESRHYLTQTLIPQILTDDKIVHDSPSAVAATDSTASKVGSKHLVRTDYRDQKIEAFTKSRDLQSLGTKKNEIDSVKSLAIEAGIGYAAKRKHPAKDNENICRISSKRNIELSSIVELRDEIERQCHPGIKNILDDFTFVGCVDISRVVIQHRTRLLLVDIANLTKELCYQLIINRFGSFSYIRLNPPPSIADLAMMALDHQDTAWTPSDGPKQDLAQFICTLLKDKAPMLLDYFSMEISENGCLLSSLPLLLDGCQPDLNMLPNFILHLATEVDWDDEKNCFQHLAKEMAELYCNKSCNDTADNDAIEFVIVPAIRKYLLPGRSLSKDNTFLELANLPGLYQVFERC